MVISVLMSIVAFSAKASAVFMRIMMGLAMVAWSLLAHHSVM